MSYVINGKTIKTDANGYLVDMDEWDEKVAQAIAAAEALTLSARSWDIIEYLRDEYLNSGHPPNERQMVKYFKEYWNDPRVDARALYECFPRGPAKQASKIAGLPETRRWGG